MKRYIVVIGACIIVAVYTFIVLFTTLFGAYPPVKDVEKIVVAIPTPCPMFGGDTMISMVFTTDLESCTVEMSGDDFHDLPIDVFTRVLAMFSFTAITQQGMTLSSNDAIILGKKLLPELFNEANCKKIT